MTVSDVAPLVIERKMLRRGGNASNREPALVAKNGLWAHLGSYCYEVRFKLLMQFNNVYSLFPESAVMMSQEISGVA